MNDTYVKTILVFGLPGSGKTTLINEFVKDNLGFVTISGGSLIDKELPPAERDKLRNADNDQILLNQDLLILNFNYEKSKFKNKHIIFDGHCMIKHGKNLTVIPLNIIEGLSPSLILFIEEKPEIIIERRREDILRPGREIETEKEIKKITDDQLRISQNYANKLNIPFVKLQSPDMKTFSLELTKFTSE